MAIRKPIMSVVEAKRLATIRSAAAGQFADPVAGNPVSPPPLRPTPSPTATPSPAVEAAPVGEARPSMPADDSASPAANMPPPATDAPPPIVGAPPPPPKIPSPAKRPAPASRSAAPPSRHLVGARSEKVQVFLSAPQPAPGVSPIFETLCRQYPPQKALQMILRRALDDYEQMLENTAFQDTAAIYAPDETGAAGSIVQTSRMMPMGLVAIARAHFDPLGLESTRAFGRKLATAALAAFFAREGKQHI